MTGHPEPDETAYPFTGNEIAHVDYLMWSHGIGPAARARVKAEMRQVHPPSWADDFDVTPGGEGVDRDDLRELYDLLADATMAAATGDPNTCASKAADAKQLVLDLSDKVDP